MSIQYLPRKMFPDFPFRECPIGVSDHISWSSSPVPSPLSSLAFLFSTCNVWSRILDTSHTVSSFLTWLQLIPSAVMYPGIDWEPSDLSFDRGEAWVRELGGCGPKGDGSWINQILSPFPRIRGRTSYLEEPAFLTFETYPLNAPQFAPVPTFSCGTSRPDVQLPSEPDDIYEPVFEQCLFPEDTPQTRQSLLPYIVPK